RRSVLPSDSAAWMRKRSITNSGSKIPKRGLSRGPPSYRGRKLIRKSRCTNTLVMKTTTISFTSWQEPVSARREGKRNEKCSRRFIVVSRRETGVGSSCVCRRIRREEAHQTARNRNEDGMDKSSCLDPYRCEKARRYRRRMDD